MSKFIEEFLASDNDVKTAIRNRCLTEGIVPKIFSPHGGYFVVFRYGESDSRYMTYLRDIVGKITPVMSYDQKSIHSSILSTNPIEGFTHDISVIRDISNRVRGAIQGKRDTNPLVRYNEILVSPQTLILSGTANKPYLDLVECIVPALEGRHGLKRSWGVYSTIVRFTEPANQETLSEVKRAINVAHRNIAANCLSIDVGFWYASKNEYSHTTLERFQLGK